MIQSYKKHLSLRVLIAVWSLGFAAVLALIVVIVSFFSVRSALTRLQAESVRNNLQLVGSDLDASLSDIESFANWCTIDPNIATYLTTLKKQTAEAASDDTDLRKQMLSTWEHFRNEYNAVGKTEFINRAVISTPDGAQYLQTVQNNALGFRTDFTKSIMQASFFDPLIEAPSYLWIGLVENPVSTYTTAEILPVVRPIYSSSSSEVIGFVYLEISPELFTSCLSGLTIPEDAEVFLSIGDGHSYAYQSNASAVSLTEAPLPDGVIDVPLKIDGFHLYMIPSKAEIRQRLNFYYRIIALIAFFILVGGVFIMHSLHVSITTPLNGLLRKISLVSQGDFSRDPSIESDTEFGSIGKGINMLSENVESLMNRRVEDERKKQALEYEILQSQINPHFIYNTLNTIKWMATIQGSDGIADMSTALSRLLRNIAKNKQNLIPLRDEKALVDDYFTIMKYRYGGTITLQYVIDDPETLSCYVNRFSIQPILENAIFHGIEPKGSAGSIVIRFSFEDVEGFSPAACLLIRVRDDGVGMDQAMIDRVMKGGDEDAHDFFRHVGVSNVNQRIKYTFGTQYGISIHSEIGVFTEMQFTLPVVKSQPDGTPETLGSVMANVEHDA